MFCDFLNVLIFTIVGTLAGACEDGLKEYVISEREMSLCFDPTVQIPCGPNVIRVDDARNYHCTVGCGVLKRNQGCCVDKTFDKTTDICCGQTLHQHVDINRWTCCGNVLMDSNKFSCCFDELERLPEPVARKRSDSSHVDQCCASGYQLPDSVDMSCCGATAYNTSTHSCCDNQVVLTTDYLCCSDLPVKIKPGANMKCCGTQAYDNYKHYRCEYGRELVLKDGPELCGEMFLQEDQQCCNHEPQPRYDHISEERRLCCGITSYVNSTQSCDFGRVVSKTETDQWRCGHENYNPDDELCCEGEIYRKFDTNNDRMTCCGWKAINNKTHICDYGRALLNCPVRVDNVTAYQWNSLNFVAIKTVRDMVKKKQVIMTCTNKCCKNQRVSIKVGETCQQFRQALKSGEIIVLHKTAEIGSKLELTYRDDWAFCQGCSLKKLRQLARKQRQDLHLSVE